MDFFVDTAEVSEIRSLAETGILDGLTTNPSLITKSGRDFKETISEFVKSSLGQFKPKSLLLTPRI